jgi:hypothetical protein
LHELDELLQHHGVKGMHWGSRRGIRATTKRYNSYNKGMKLLDRHKLKKLSDVTDRSKYLDDRDKKWLDKVSHDKNIQKVSKRTAKEMNKVNKQLKKQYGGTGLKGNAKRAMNGQLNAAYMKEMKGAYEEVLKDSTYSVYKLSPSRTREVEIKPLPDGTLKATIVERDNPKLAKQRAAITKALNKAAKKAAKSEEPLTHADKEIDSSNLDGMFFLIKPDEDGFPDDVISPFDDIQHGINELLQHSGVKGMHWGQHHGGHGSGVAFKERGKVGRHLDSLKRERVWSKSLSEAHSMSTKDINKLTSRITAENTFKGLTKHKMATSKDKQDYLRRHEMSDEELKRKTSRLQAKVKLHDAVKGASKAQREAAIKVGQTAGSLGVKYVLNGGKLSVKDVVKNTIDAHQNPTIKTKQDVWDNSVKIGDKHFTNPKVKSALNLARTVKVDNFVKTKKKS